MAENISDLSRALSDILTGEYSKKRQTQEELAARAEMSIWTLQKKLRGRAPISATDLVVISQAIGVDPAKVLDEAIEMAGMTLTDAVAMSEQPVSLDAHREKKNVADMSVDEIESMRKKAATSDDDLDKDEPDTP